MKIIGSIERHYNTQLAKYGELRQEVDNTLGNIAKRNKWHYTSRLKEPESYALKLETGEKIDPIAHSMEDFFACTLIVDNYHKIEAVKHELKNYVIIKCKRPKSAVRIRKSPDSFPYDSIRLYVKLKPQQNLPKNHSPNNLTDILFEIQVKTFFQHTWDIAVHNLIYKGKEISWPEKRVAYQIKAMLEHAEVSIQEIDQLKSSKILDIHDKQTDRLIELQKFFQKNWEPEQLPTDLNRLSQNLDFLLKNSKINLEEMQTILDEEMDAKRGPRTMDLSPYFTIVQTIINKRPQKMQNFLNSKRTKKIVIPAEVKITDITSHNNKIIRIE